MQPKKKTRSFASVGDLRVISGEYKRKRLFLVRNTNTHPMGSREKLATFNMLQAILVENGQCLQDLWILDAFAGTGALGIEALSRGAQNLCFVEKDPQAAQIIEKNLQSVLDEQKNTQIFAMDTEKFVKNPVFSEFFDLIFADPPYDHFVIEEVGVLLSCLKLHGYLVLSSPLQSAEQGMSQMSSLVLLKTRQYARARIDIYQKVSPE